MQLHELRPTTPNKSKKRVGRGGKRGKTSGRGTKGQKARAGHRIRPDIREQLKKLPKLRGYQQKSIQTKPFAVNVGTLERVFSAGETVSLATLSSHGLVRSGRKILPVKILSGGDISKKLVIVGCAVSKAARVKIEAAGGAIQ